VQEIWAYCLMPNHVHLFVTPRDRNGPRTTFGEAHRRYTRAIQRAVRLGAPFIPGPLRRGGEDEPHLQAAARSIALNAVVAGLVSQAGD
jgi:putative transposase